MASKAAAAYQRPPVLSRAATEMLVSVAMLEGQCGVMLLLLWSLPAEDTNSTPLAAAEATAVCGRDHNLAAAACTPREHLHVLC